MAWILLKPSNYKQVAPLVRTGGSRHTGLAALPHRNIHTLFLEDNIKQKADIFTKYIRHRKRHYISSVILLYIRILQAGKHRLFLNILLFVKLLFPTLRLLYRLY